MVSCSRETNECAQAADNKTLHPVLGDIGRPMTCGSTTPSVSLSLSLSICLFQSFCRSFVGCMRAAWLQQLVECFVPVWLMCKTETISTFFLVVSCSMQTIDYMSTFQGRHRTLFLFRNVDEYWMLINIAHDSQIVCTCVSVPIPFFHARCHPLLSTVFWVVLWAGWRQAESTTCSCWEFQSLLYCIPRVNWELLWFRWFPPLSTDCPVLCVSSHFFASHFCNHWF